ncbi:hypothetical protein B0O99DRAFT_709504 [Bisporella sp. PMI_857]|nr:hypothetical protein B0O99DRAFT_709504 [Bisporella sp. PMI_857]
MPSRRTHKKSRFGCSQCKSRKVKCDEASPSCRKCSIAGVVCNYQTNNLLVPTSGTTFTAPLLKPAPTISLPLSLSHPGHTTAQPTFDLLDLTLMNHFTAVTSLKLFSEEKQQDLWQKDIPFEARSYPLLMHGLLSVASLHLALLEPKNKLAYRIRALYHHNVGLQLFNSQICYLSSGNSHALFGFAFMLVIWVYASPEENKNALQLKDILDLLDLVRGCKAVFELQSGAILSSRFGSFIEFQYWKRPARLELELSPAVQRTLQYLRTKAIDTIHITAIDDLERLLKRSITEPHYMRAGVAWVAVVTDTYWIRLKSYEPVAMLIFAHYAMLLQWYEDQRWWMAGWPERVLQTVSDALQDTDKTSLGWDVCLAGIHAYRRDISCQQFHSAEILE